MLLTTMRPPRLALPQIMEFVAERYGVSGEWVGLEGERDQNFRVTGAAGAFVVKVCHPAEGVTSLEAQVGVLEHIARVDPGLAVPRVRRALDAAALREFIRAECEIIGPDGKVVEL